LIRRLAAENCLWGAPRIHGELLKLGIVVSERTVSRYLLPDRLRAPSQTWRTFLANHLGQFTFNSPDTSLDAPSRDDVVDGSGLTSRHTPSSCQAPYASYQGAVVEHPSPQRTPPGKHIDQDRLHDRISVRTISGRGPPPYGRSADHVYVRRVDGYSCIGSATKRCQRLTAGAAGRRGQRRRQTNHLRSGAVYHRVGVSP
jgi:hypothetical protein